MVHDIKNLTFSEEICGCSAWTPADLLQGGRESSALVDNFSADLGGKWRKPEGELQVQQQCKDQERHCKDCSNYHCRIR